MITRETYVAEDGTEFTDMDECLEHDKLLAIEAVKRTNVPVSTFFEVLERTDPKMAYQFALTAMKYEKRRAEKEASRNGN